LLPLPPRASPSSQNSTSRRTNADKYARKKGNRVAPRNPRRKFTLGSDDFFPIGVIDEIFGSEEIKKWQNNPTLFLPFLLVFCSFYINQDLSRLATSRKLARNPSFCQQFRLLKILFVAQRGRHVEKAANRVIKTISGN